MSCATTPDTQNYVQNTDYSATRRRERGRVKSIVQAYIAANFRPLRNGAWHLANAARVESIRTAEGWLAGRSWPRDDDLLELCISCNDLQMELHDLALSIRKERTSK